MLLTVIDSPVGGGTEISRTFSLFIQLVLAIAALVITGEQSSVGNRSALVVILFYI